MKPLILLLTLGLATWVVAEPAKPLVFAPRSLEDSVSVAPLVSSPAMRPLVIASSAWNQHDAYLRPNPYGPRTNADLFLSVEDQRRILAHIRALFRDNESDSPNGRSRLQPERAVFNDHLPLAPTGRTGLLPLPAINRSF